MSDINTSWLLFYGSQIKIQNLKIIIIPRQGPNPLAVLPSQAEQLVQLVCIELSFSWGRMKQAGRRTEWVTPARLLGMGGVAERAELSRFLETFGSIDQEKSI